MNSINLLVLQILTSQICKSKEILYIMKATGIVRRIDDLGRVVIPKEIRRTMRIREGDPLEIYTDREGEVIFKKYSPIGELTGFAAQYAETLHKTCDLSVIICDRDSVVACAGAHGIIMIHWRKTLLWGLFDSPIQNYQYQYNIFWHQRSYAGEA